MIFTDRTIIVKKGTSSIDDTIVLYRGDKDVEIRFTLNENSPFKFGSGSSPNIIEKTEAAYGQLIIKRPNDLPAVFSEIAPTNEGKIVFTITAEMIDEITEVGNYTFQIRLLDESRNSRATLPEVVDGIEIREPIASEDTTNEVGVATVGYALTTAGTPEDAFDSEGNYNKTTWAAGDRITDTKLNKIEDGIDEVNRKVANVNNINDTTASTTTTYSSDKIENIKEELSSQIKEIENIEIEGLYTNTIYNSPSYEISNDYSTSSNITNVALALTSDQFLSTFLDSYVGKTNTYSMSKQSLGKDQSGIYDIYEYDFKPKKWNRVILLTAGMHGIELSAVFGLAYFIKSVIEDHNDNLGLKYIFKNVRIKFIPILNPWGFSQNPKVYGNSRGVNINRNFDYNGQWEQVGSSGVSGWSNPGTSAWSEAESVILKNWLLTNKNAEFHIDCHTYVGNSSYTNYVVYDTQCSNSNDIDIVLGLLDKNLKDNFGVSSFNDLKEAGNLTYSRLLWTVRECGIPSMLVEQSAAATYWGGTSLNNEKQDILNFVTNLTAYVTQFLLKETQIYELKDYVFKLMQDIYELKYYNTIESDTPVTFTYTITNNLTNVTNSNTATIIEKGSSYTVTLTANTDYTLSDVTVTMGGIDVTSTVYNDGNINITSVTGNIVITATAIIISSTDTVLYEQGGIHDDGTDIPSDFGLAEYYTNRIRTAYIDVSNNSTVTMSSPSGLILVELYQYDENKTMSGNLIEIGNSQYTYTKPSSGIKYIRVLIRNGSGTAISPSDGDLVITKN